MDIQTGQSPETGYMVARMGTARVVPVEQSSPKHIADYVNSNEDALSEDEAHLGGWRDNGLDYVEQSERFGNQSVAFAHAYRNNQQAYYALDSGEDVTNPMYDPQGDSHFVRERMRRLKSLDPNPPG